MNQVFFSDFPPPFLTANHLDGLMFCRQKRANLLARFLFLFFKDVNVPCVCAIETVLPVKMFSMRCTV